MSAPHYDLDVRPILREGGEPFSAIMEAVAALGPGQSLRLLVSFKPIPLFQVLGARGFEPSAKEIGNGDWEVVFTPVGAAQQVGEPSERSASTDDMPRDWPEPIMELDNRDLEPPEPMVRTLQAVKTLALGQTMAVLLPREPVFLFDELQVRGHRWRGTFEPQGHYRIVIRSGGSGGRVS
ncbi:MULTISPECIES: DUF2249 domain-containing protein [unclassified Mesorhizobium]|uniref:DUF2249 domain-containing protein n=1 Tax=unclassified Mesorhizobium TaxID=325217 RepID=UPI00112C3B46|nr:MULTISPECIES: DUF2249 domain-containing protein [unclassified Mesorhizobium]TPJ41002.1 DUF2249 domain-containing protein [Mesorhizobium sp. B2-6-6]MCA0008715.1 DUF2249 domain-containing protein [Mesorhizobium sp. B264B1B]MCA0019407.1 DUF2249 domain-containing protein [Mesorhizobium sp. B264B1A]MCA0024552.1 DUF2249 domain-containing protein [Mesorhizobium sp. B263B1A]MCA0055776.1 DUF2249 domain-containing protein [Mesorhizobium sp. B261B1A]